MKWKLIFSSFFIASVIMMFVYINKKLVIYSRTMTEKIPLVGGGYSTEPVAKTFQDNYSSNGAVIGFGILAGASLISVALTIRKEKSPNG